MSDIMNNQYFLNLLKGPDSPLSRTGSQYLQTLLAGGQMQPVQDVPDFTQEYNTVLTAEENVQFQNWLEQQSQKEGRNIAADLKDYDLRGAWKAQAEQASNGHLPDTYKKPNHPTFSQESIYNTTVESGGTWQNVPPYANKTVFNAAPSNVKTYGTQGLKNYFQKAEPDAQLKIPPPFKGAL